jgi:hypothetical protein
MDVGVFKMERLQMKVQPRGARGGIWYNVVIGLLSAILKSKSL